MIAMYEEYESKIKKYAHLLRAAVIGFFALILFAALAAGYVFGIGVSFGEVECASVDYGRKPDPHLSSPVRTEFEYYLVVDGKASKTEQRIPEDAGHYEVRAYTVSLVGIRKYAGKTEFDIRPVKLRVEVPQKEDYLPVEEIVIDPSDCTVKGLVNGDVAEPPVLEFAREGSTTGTYKAVSVEIRHSDGSAANHCYDISYGGGTVRDIRIDLTVTAGSKKEKYAGDPMYVVKEAAYKTSGGSLMAGHTAHFKCEGQQVGIGSSVNKIAEDSRFITDSDGKDVSYMYRMTFLDGKLELQPRTLKVRSDSASKLYDGTPLTKHSCTITGDGLCEGDTLDLTYTGTRTYPGKSKNTFEDCRVTSVLFGDVTNFYAISSDFGTLTIWSDGEEGGSGSDPEEFNMDGDSSNFSWDLDPNNKGVKLFEYMTGMSGSFYFREHTYGIYTGHSFRMTPGESDFGDYGHFLTGNAIRSSGGSSTMLYVRDKALSTTPYPYFMAADKKDYNGTDSLLYDYQCEVYQLPSGDFPVSVNSEKNAYEAFVTENYLDVPDDVLEVLLRLGREAGISENDENLIDEISYYISHAAKYNLKFKTFPSDQDMVIYFLTVSKEGICQHYAAAATLMYRAYGIPARFVVGYHSDGSANRWNMVGDADGHAWTEIYLNGTGWIPVEVTGAMDQGLNIGINDGSGTSQWYEEIPIPFDDPKTITVAFTYYEKEYDGLPVYGIEPEGTFVTGTLKPGHSIVCSSVIMNSSADAGEKIFPYEVIVEDLDHNNVSDEYNIIVLNPPTINIKRRAIEITTYGNEGRTTDKRVENTDWYISRGTLVSGERIELTMDASQYEIGTSYNTPRYIHVITSGGQDVTDYYKIDIVSGVLKLE